MTTRQTNLVFASALVLPAMVSLTGGCASTRCALRKTDPSVDLAKYTTCYVENATAAGGVVVPANLLRDTGNRIASELRGRKTFKSVLTEPPDEQSEYLKVKTVYTSYRPGSRMLRGLLIGLGTADLRIQVQLQEGRDGRQLATGGVHEYWGWGGLRGMSRGVEGMQKSAFKHIGVGIHKACRRSGRRK